MTGEIFIGCKEVFFNLKENLDVTNHQDYQVLSKTNDDLIFNQKGVNNHVN